MGDMLNQVQTRQMDGVILTQLLVCQTPNSPILFHHPISPSLFSKAGVPVKSFRLLYGPFFPIVLFLPIWPICEPAALPRRSEVTRILRPSSPFCRVPTRQNRLLPFLPFAFPFAGCARI